MEIPFPHATFIYFLHFIYTGTIEMKTNEIQTTIQSLYSLAQEWQVIDLAALIMK